MTAPALPRPTVESARADLAAAEAEHTRLVGVAVSRSNRPGEHDSWGDVRTAAGVVHQARATLARAERNEPCLAVVQDNDRFTTHCARVAGHDGGHIDTIPMGMTPEEWEAHVRSYR